MKTALLSDVEALFDRTYRSGKHAASRRRFFSPARINLIGEHIDYCGGVVMPAAVQFGTCFVAGPNDDNTVRVVSLNQPDHIEFDPQADLARSDPVSWGDYVKGVYVEYGKLGVEVPALDIAVGGDIPGGGMSSSASLEIGIAVMLEAFTGHRASPDRFANRQAMSRLAQRAENEFVGVQCGIMDHGAVALGRRDHAMLLDCSDLSVTYVPVVLDDYCFLVADTGKSRKLAESAYNERRREVEQALAKLKQVVDVDNLCQVPVARLEEMLLYLDDPVIARRARHVITEQQRVTDAALCLQQGDLPGFGKLLDDSHRSLKDDFEVTGRELDVLIGLAQQQPGVLGARMMGAGFGGCGLVLLETAAVADFTRVVGKAYRADVGYDAACHRVEIGPGADEIMMNR